MSKGKLKTSIILFFIIVLLFILCVGFIMLFKPNSVEKTVNAKDVTYKADTNIVQIKNIISVSTEFGKTIHEDNNGAFGYLSFDVVNHTNEVRNYQIYITRIDSTESGVNPGYITYYLTDNKDNPLEGYTRNSLPTYDSLYFIEDKADSKSLYKGSLGGNETAHFLLRVWIAEPYVIHEPEEIFLFKIDARAI